MKTIQIIDFLRIVAVDMVLARKRGDVLQVEVEISDQTELLSSRWWDDPHAKEIALDALMVLLGIMSGKGNWQWRKKYDGTNLRKD